MPRLLALFVALLVPAVAQAQRESPKAVPPPPNFKAIAIGGFLGQLDGWCEQPGGTYDLTFIDDPQVLSCAGEKGTLPDKKTWPVAMGGLFGAQEFIKAKRDKSTLILIPGNNQVANFTFLDRTKLLEGTANFQRLASVSPDASKDEQTLNRFQRFWQEMAQIEPTAIGLAVEDFVRSLRDPREDNSTTIKDRGSILHRWLKLATEPENHLPIIGSNAVIKMSSSLDLNTVKAGDFSLVDMPKHESVGWNTKLTVAHPARAGIDLELWEAGPIGKPYAQHLISTTTTKGAATTELNVVGGALRPGFHYQVRVRDGSQREMLTFQTHSALTPHKNRTGNLDGFPVVTKKLPDGSPLLIVSLIDQGVKGFLGDAWKWDNKKKCSDGDYCDWDNEVCPAERCEIDFIKPADAVTAVLKRSFLKVGDPKPFIILLSALTDQQTEELLEEFPEIRLVVLDPETYMMGRGSREYKTDLKDELEKRLAQRKDPNQKYSGDLAMSGIINGHHPSMTTLMARAEWIGEWAAVIDANVQYSKEEFEWEIRNAAIKDKTVPGGALTWEPHACPPGTAPTAECTAFRVQLKRADGTIKDEPYGSLVSYHVCEGKLDAETQKPGALLIDQCDVFSKLLKNGDFMALAGDSFRRATGSQLAVVPGTLIDPDAQAWLEPILSRNYTRVMTRFILERAIFRSFRIVRASVQGDQLVATLDKALKLATFPRTCVFGTDGGCTTKIDPKKPDQVLANGRLVDSRAFYTIAMPEGMAAELKLPYSKGSRYTTDAVSALHQRLISDGKEGWYVSGNKDTLAPRLESRARNSVQIQALMSALEIGYSDFHLEPDPRDVTDEGKARTKQLTGLDVEFAGTKPSTKWTGKTDMDYALDTRWLAARWLFNADLSRRLDYKATGNELVFDKNTFTRGWRVDGKLPLFKREVRPYFGHFVDGEIKGPPEYKTAKYIEERPDGFKKTTSAPVPMAFEREPRRFRYQAVGIDVLNIWKIAPTSALPLDIKKFSIQYASGTINKVIGAKINSDPQPGDWAALGTQGALDAWFDQHRDAFSPGTPQNITFTAVENDIPQKRWQAEVSFEPRLVFKSRTWKFGTDLRFRRFQDPRGASDLKNYFKSKFTLSLPVTTRIELVPSYEYHHATVHDSAAAPFLHSKFEATVKLPLALLGGVKWPGWIVR